MVTVPAASSTSCQVVGSLSARITCSGEAAKFDVLPTFMTGMRGGRCGMLCFLPLNRGNKSFCPYISLHLVANALCSHLFYLNSAALRLTMSEVAATANAIVRLTAAGKHLERMLVDRETFATAVVSG